VGFYPTNPGQLVKTTNLMLRGQSDFCGWFKNQWLRVYFNPHALWLMWLARRLDFVGRT